MPATQYDVVVVGLGTMGSAAAWHLAKRGRRVLGLDRYYPPHTLGSSHGRSRIIREAYFEHPLYVPLVRRAYEGWAELERESGRSLLTITGGLMIGPATGTLVDGARRSARDHGIPVEEMSASEVRGRFPALRVAESEVGLLEPRAGVLRPEECVAAALERAQTLGADLRGGEPVTHWEVTKGAVRVETERGHYRAGRMILCAGAWMAGALAGADLGLTVERQVLFWFRPAASPERFTAGRLPIFLWEWAPARYLYGFPDQGDGVKIARHHEGEATTADSVHRSVGRDEETGIRSLLERMLPDANGPLLDASVCLYTNARDGHFVLDYHPVHPEVIVVSPCSGHGFKFACAIGEIVADMVMTGRSRFDLTPFRIGRPISSERS